MRSIIGSNKGWSKLRAKKKTTYRKLPCYEARKVQLIKLGYKNYAEYLESELWQSIKKSLLRRHKLCVICGNSSVVLHHLSYDADTLLGVTSHCLVSLCNPCHAKIEFDNGKKRTIKQANKVLFTEAAKSPLGQRWITHQENKRLEYERSKTPRQKNKKINTQSKKLR